MTKQSLKSQATEGMLWSALEKFSVQGIQFILGIALARLLLPSDYGLIGMLAIFIAISQWFTDSGFSTALIQKNNRTNVDFSTVFYFNVGVSVIIYIVLFTAAPLISKFYNQAELTLLTRVLSLNIIISAFSIIQNTKLTIDLDFRSIAVSNFIAVVFSGVIGILVAYSGRGVWSLVFQSISRAVILAIILWSLSKWKPKLIFSRYSFRVLFKFGSRLLAAGMIATVLRNIYSIMIGKFFTSAQLGYFTRAKDFTDLTSDTITSILSKVTFPVLAELQDDNERLVSAYRKLVRMSAFVIFPLMGLLAVIADPFIRVLLTEKWIEVVPLLQLLCIARVLTPVSTLNMNILNVIGRSDLFLKIDVLKIPLIIGTLIITIPFGVKAIVFGHIFSTFFSYLINTYYPSKLFNYGFAAQMIDIGGVILSTFIMISAVYTLIHFLAYDILKLTLGIPFGIIIYLLIARLTRSQELSELTVSLKTIIRRK